MMRLVTDPSSSVAHAAAKKKGVAGTDNKEHIGSEGAVSRQRVRQEPKAHYTLQLRLGSQWQAASAPARSSGGGPRCWWMLVACGGRGNAANRLLHCDRQHTRPA